MTGKDEHAHSDPARAKDLDEGYDYPGRRTPPGHVPEHEGDNPGTGLSDAERRRGDGAPNDEPPAPPRRPG